MTPIHGYVPPTTDEAAVGIHSLDQFVLSVPDLKTAQHFYTTFGLDVRLFYTTLFGLLSEFGVRASGVVDITPSYVQFAVSLGIWH